MSCGCSGGACCAGAGCAAVACCASTAAMAAIIACSAIRNSSDYEPEPFDIVCKTCDHDQGEHNKFGCSHTDGFFHKKQCNCKHFNYDRVKVEKAKNDIIKVLFKNVHKADELMGVTL